MKVKDLKKILKAMDDDAEIVAASRGDIHLSCIEVVNHPSPIKMKKVYYYDSLLEVYGGKEYSDFHPNVKQVIILVEKS